MVQLLYKNEATYKRQFFEIQFLRNRLDSQLNSANKFTNAVRRVNRLCVGEPRNYGLIPMWGKRSLSCSECRDELRETFGIPFNVYGSGRGESQRQKRPRRKAEQWPVSNFFLFVFGTNSIRGLGGFVVSLDIEQTACNWPDISNGLYCNKLTT
jgi:hypothetical protein